MSADPLTILTGDVREVLPGLGAESVHCVVTSPPYWGLRSYLPAGDALKGREIGQEGTPEEYVRVMVEVFRKVRRVLRRDGTLWLNLGDSYASNGGHADKHCNERRGRRNIAASPEHEYRQFRAGGGGLKAKDMVGIPWRVALALQADGWYLRQDIIWHKPNPMPESVRDRCTKAHEYVFMLTKGARYYYDGEAIAEPLATASVERLSQEGLEEQAGSDRVPGKTNGNMKAVYAGSSKAYKGRATKDFAAGGAQDASATKARIVDRILAGEIVSRNKRSVWTVATQPYKGAHFATFPRELIRPCVLAGCPAGGVVLDPFGGSGTTGAVALECGRRAVLVELDERCVGLMGERCAVTVGLGI